jgi:two-component system OmpR family response regulator
MMSYDTPSVLAVGADWANRSCEGGGSSKILIINGDAESANVSVELLDSFGFEVAAAQTLDDGLRSIASTPPDLVLLGLQLGQSEGLRMLGTIRAQSNVPVIVIPGHESDKINCASYLELGADDCLAEPPGQRELVSRIRAVLRRAPKVRATPKRCEGSSRYRFGDWVLDRRLRTLTDRTGARVLLTNSDFALLVAFLEAPQTPLSREHLLHATRMHEDIIDRAIDIKVLRLRKKLEKDPTEPQIIQTERGVGYVFTLPVERFEG